MTNKILIVNVGLPGSGKSTWAKRTGSPVVSIDAINVRFADLIGTLKPLLDSAHDVSTEMKIARRIVKVLFRSHDTVIVDGPHVKQCEREFWRDENWTVHLHVLDVSKDKCIKQIENAHFNPDDEEDRIESCNFHENESENIPFPPN